MSIRWNGDFDAVFRDASGSGKPILLDFSARRCEAAALSWMLTCGRTRAETRMRHVVEKHPDAEAAPEGLYWAGVSRYKG